MHFALWLPGVVLAAGCAAHIPVAQHVPSVAPPAPTYATTLAETEYVVGHRRGVSGTIVPTSSTIARSTRVPTGTTVDFATVPRDSFPPASITPLPVSDELAAELATQRQLTAELRALKRSMELAEQQLQEQYAVLLRQSAEVQRAKEQLEDERVRLRSGVVPASSAAAAKPVESTAKPSW